MQFSFGSDGPGANAANKNSSPGRGCGLSLLGGSLGNFLFSLIVIPKALLETGEFEKQPSRGGCRDTLQKLDHHRWTAQASRMLHKALSSRLQALTFLGCYTPKG
eukprot:s9801_g1.t1